MRRLLPAVVLALIGAFVPLPAAASGEVEALASGNVHFLNGHPAPTVIDICLGTETLADDLANGETADVELPGGNQAVSVAVSPETCAGTTVPIVGGIDVLGGGQVTGILGPAPGQATQGVNDTSTTPAETTRLTLRNGTQALPELGICLDGELVEGSTVPGTSGQAQVEVPSGPYEITLSIAGTCVVEEQQPVTLAACTNLVLNVYLTGGEDVADADSQLLIVGCELPPSADDIAAFCAVLPELQTVPDELAALFVDADIDDPSTFPTVAEVQAFVESVDALLAAGDAVVPETVRPQWLIATDGLRQLVAGLTAASFDFETIAANNPEGAQQIIDGARGETPPDPATEAAVEVLTAFFLENCLPPEPPPAAPIEAVVRFAG